MFSGIYAPCSSYTDDVKLFLREIEEVRSFWNYPSLIGGDFNEIRFCHERSTGSDSTIGMRRFNNFISKHKLIDLPLELSTGKARVNPALACQPVLGLGSTLALVLFTNKLKTPTLALDGSTLTGWRVGLLMLSI